MTSKSEVSIKDFQSFLQRCLNCKHLELINLEATNLLPLGENYCSLMLKLKATIRKSKDAKIEQLHFVAKTPQATERPIIYWSEVFPKEVFLYDQLIPAYQSLEKELGIEPVLDVVPKCIGYRSSLNDNNDVIDENSMLLMENLKTRHYYNCDRHIGMDLEHAKIALTSLARYHALGIALRQKRPKFFETVIANAQIYGIDFPQLDEGFDAILKIFCETPALNKHLPLIKTIFAEVKNGKACEWRGAEPWVTIIHGDFWCNNMLFHKNKQGHVDDVKFVDFQTYLYCSPLKDLPYFLCASLDEETEANHFDELLNVYYDSFTRHLERLNCDTRSFGKESFDCELKREAINEFPLCAMAIKFFGFEIEDKHNESKNLCTDVFDSETSDVILKKLQKLIDVYEKRGWF